MSEILTLLASLVLTDLLEPEPSDAPTAVTVATDESKLQTPTFLSHRSDEATALLEGVRTTLDTELSESDRRRLGRKVLSETRVRMAEGAFPQSGAIVVTVNVPLRMKDPLAEQRFISGVFTLDGAGALASIVEPPKMQTRRFDLARIGDVDGDGLDDLELAITGGDSDERRVVTWK
jgi:hypothetical protein